MQHIPGLFSTHGLVEAVECDAAFMEHMASERRGYEKHAVSPQEIAEAQAGAPAFFENIGKRRAPIVMAGPTQAGRMIAVPLEPTERKGVWRAVTAFEANAHHQERYEKEMANG